MNVFSWLIPNVPIPTETYATNRPDLIAQLVGHLLEVSPDFRALPGLLPSEVAVEHGDFVGQLGLDQAETAATIFENLSPQSFHVVSMEPDVVWYRGVFTLARFAATQRSGFWVFRRSLGPAEELEWIGAEYVFADEATTVAEGDSSDFPSELLADALQRHARLQNKVAQWLIDEGIAPISPKAHEPRFDIAWTRNECVFVAEVKSLTHENEVRQIRYGIGQVLDYASRVSAVPVLIIDKLPTDVELLRAARLAGVRVLIGDELMLRQPKDIG